jgi:acetyl esterase/lipase
MLPVIVYMHGGGWILGNAGTHDRLVRELAVGARAALAFVEYPNSPEARYPVAIEQGYATAQWITRDGASRGLDASRMAVAGESVGGNMTAALALMAKERGDVTFVQQSMYYPVTDAAMNTASYEQFATGYYLTRKRCSGSGTPIPPIRHSAPRSPHHRIRPTPRRSPGCRPPICASTRPTYCAMREKPTPPSSDQRVSR